MFWPAAFMAPVRAPRGRYGSGFLEPDILKPSRQLILILSMYFGSDFGFLLLVGGFRFFEYVEEVLALWTR